MLHAGAARHVVDDDRQRRALGDRAVVLVQPFLRRLVVVRRHRQEARRAAPSSSRRASVDHLPRVVAAGAGQHRHAGRSASSTTISTIAQPLGVASASGSRRSCRTGTRKWMPASICRRAEPPHRRFVELAARVNGVTSAVPTPVNGVLICVLPILPFADPLPTPHLRDPEHVPHREPAALAVHPLRRRRARRARTRCDRAPCASA